MDLEEFEQLVSEWLDRPERADLRQRINAAAAADPALAIALGEWRRLNDLLRREPHKASQVDWSTVRGRIAQAVDEDSASGRTSDTDLDELIGRLPGLEGRIDWGRLADRLSVAVEREAQSALRRRAKGQWRVAAAALMATAAALIFLFMPPTGPGAGARGLVAVAIAPPAFADEARGVAVVEIRAIEDYEPEPERFFVIDPLVATGPKEEVPDYY